MDMIPAYLMLFLSSGVFLFYGKRKYSISKRETLLMPIALVLLTCLTGYYYFSNSMNAHQVLNPGTHSIMSREGQAIFSFFQIIEIVILAAMYLFGFGRW